MSGYVGNAKSSEGNEMSIDYYSMVVCGFETLDINNISIKELINNLCLGAKQSLNRVIDAYNLLPEIKEDAIFDKAYSCKSLSPKIFPILKASFDSLMASSYFLSLISLVDKLIRLYASLKVSFVATDRS